ncbi:hypothetical protein GCM10009573_05330 [Agromyces bracchium]
MNAKLQKKIHTKLQKLSQKSTGVAPFTSLTGTPDAAPERHTSGAAALDGTNSRRRGELSPHGPFGSGAARVAALRC